MELPHSSACSVAEADLDDNEPKTDQKLEGGLLGRLSILGGAKAEHQAIQGTDLGKRFRRAIIRKFY